MKITLLFFVEEMRESFAKDSHILSTKNNSANDSHILSTKNNSAFAYVGGIYLTS